MPIDAQLLEILVCPDNHSPLTIADDSVLEALNARITKGGVTNVGGAGVEMPLTGGLLRQDGGRLYPVRDGIPVLLIDEGLEIK